MNEFALAIISIICYNNCLRGNITNDRRLPLRRFLVELPLKGGMLMGNMNKGENFVRYV